VVLVSWDAFLVADVPDYRNPVSEWHAIFGEWNYTSNTNGMIRATGCDWPLDFGGRSGPDGAAYLHRVITALESDPVRFEAMNPPNGWGSYESLLDVLREMRAAVPEELCTWGIMW